MFTFLIVVFIAAIAYFAGHYIGYITGESEQAAYAEEMREKQLQEARKGGR